MGYNIQSINTTGFRINNHFVYKKNNGDWVAVPPLDCPEMKKTVNQHISTIDE
ncbi:hypothetical protein TMP248_60130 [Tenacibaculum maritimum]|uniref:hypothetical protein n=1 Tax=Tenacibaculum maritimum TaxID=107401 RepID=UPI0012E646EC|nr:hypothetical protein [Tenacibaculum maritimum]CAA0248050.1 hypothetical protein TMP248_60130 [Tenacibaculum maritimum]